MRICQIRVSREIRQKTDHIVKLDNSRERTYTIQDMFPITEEYKEREYKSARNHLMLMSEHTAREIEQKA